MNPGNGYSLPPPAGHHHQQHHQQSDMSQQMPPPYGHAPPSSSHQQQQQHHQPQAAPQAMSQHQYPPASHQQHQGHHAPPTSHQQPPSHAHQYQPMHHQQPQQAPPPPQPGMMHPPSAPPQALPPPSLTRHGDSGMHRPNATENPTVPFSFVDKETGRKFSLDVAQQPLRARMCGFGDKDRRPITPPPCVRLVITTGDSGKEIDPNEVDHCLFVLNVDLWSEDSMREVNLVKSSTGSPSISSTTPYSYSTLNGAGPEPSQSPYGAQSAYGQPGVGYVSDYQVPQGYAPVGSNYQSTPSYGPPQQYYPQHGYRPEQGVPSIPSQPMPPYSRNGMPGYDQGALARAMGGDSRSGMFTRNLIGQLAASAFKLHDTGDRLGIWFILQDLSVRTEGSFRLRFSVVNVGAPGGVKSEEGTPKLNTGRAPILASCFSEVFHVYSAKKFPGVCESTPLSKTFATQGIKIPIRKDTKGGGGDDDDDGY